MSAKYREKSNEVEAFKFYVDAFPDWFTNAVTENKVILHDCNYQKSFKVPRCEIKTLEETMVAHEGDYIIKDINGELRPCKPDIFEVIYEEVGNLNLSATIDIDLVVDKLSKKIEESISGLQNPSQITINGSLSKVDMEGLKSCEALTIKRP